jgi:hypothetical protein
VDPQHVLGEWKRQLREEGDDVGRHDVADEEGRHTANHEQAACARIARISRNRCVVAGIGAALAGGSAHGCDRGRGHVIDVVERPHAADLEHDHASTGRAATPIGRRAGETTADDHDIRTAWQVDHTGACSLNAESGRLRSMPRLIRLDTGDEIGTITAEHLQFLVEQLEEEHDDDKNYFIDRETMELLSDNGADPELLAMLEKGLAGDDEMDIAWE